MKRQVDRTAMVELFQNLRAQHPALTMNLKLDDPNVDVNMDIPKQPGLAFDVNLNLQGDELHLSAGALWLEWFPCSDARVLAQYREAVTGLLSGSYRIVEQYIARLAIKAQLQRPSPGGWRTVGTWANLGVMLPWPRRTRVLQNQAVDQ